MARISVRADFEEAKNGVLLRANSELECLNREKNELSEKGVRVRVIGELDRLSRSARGAVDDIENTINLLTGFVLSLGAKDRFHQSL